MAAFAKINVISMIYDNFAEAIMVNKFTSITLEPLPISTLS